METTSGKSKIPKYLITYPDRSRSGYFFINDEIFHIYNVNIKIVGKRKGEKNEGHWRRLDYHSTGQQ